MQSQLKSLQGSQEKIDKENVVREYKFDPNARLMTLLKDFKVLGQLLFEQSGSTGIPQQMKRISISNLSIRIKARKFRNSKKGFQLQAFSRDKILETWQKRCTSINLCSQSVR